MLWLLIQAAGKLASAVLELSTRSQAFLLEQTHRASERAATRDQSVEDNHDTM
jgi:hypothetical protein